MSTATIAPAPVRHEFDLARAVAFDVETYIGHWCVGFLGRDEASGELRSFVVQDVARLRRALTRFAAQGRTLVGFNSESFDVPIVRTILSGLDPYAPAQAIIRGDGLPIPAAKLPPLGVDHIDLAARFRRGGRIPGLKTLAANLGRPRLRELPYPPDTTLDDAQWAEVVAYNRLDLEHTWAILENVAPDLQALAALSEELGQDLRSTPTPRVVEQVFLDAYRRKRHGDPARPEPPHEVLYRPVAGVVEPRTPEAAEWYRKVAGRPLRMVPRGEGVVPEVPSARFAIGNLRLSVGAGGLHSIDEPRVYFATRKRRLISIDVASYYPSLIATKGISPRAYGDLGADLYRSVLERRLAVKRRARDATDPAERERLDVQANGLKLVLNSTFGKLGDRFSTLYDPAAFLAVTLSGQIMLLDLIERLVGIGVPVVAANTDGLFLRPRRGDDRWREVLADWQRDTAMTLEVEPLRRLVVLATNRYATRDTHDKVKRKGDGLKGSFSPFASPNSLIVNDAVARALLFDVPPERTVRECTDPARFCNVTRRTAAVVRAELVDEATGETTELGKLTRWYKARESSLKVRHTTARGHTTPRNAVGIALAADLTPGTIPADLDRSWYIAQARKAIQGVPGYPHRAGRFLRDNPPALAVREAGLVPCPKREKAQPAGSDPGRPTYLWDWDRFPTVGTYTGPAAGVLVLDTDDPIKFRKWVDRGNSPLLQNRWRDLEGCLVSCHGDATAADVRSGRARGKLIFRFEAGPDDPLARLARAKWLESRGIEVFYGKGIPSVLGRHPSGEQYRIEGTLGPPPPWLVEGLIPKGKGINARARTERPPIDPEAIPEELRDELLVELAGLDEALGRSAVGWRSKELDDGRRLWVGRCPFEHESGTSNPDDLAAGFDREGLPYVRCQHASCSAVPAINARLRAGRSWVVRAEGPAAVEPPPVEPGAIARAMLATLAGRRIALDIAPTGSGKSYAAAQVAAVRYRQDRATLLALPTIRLAEETVERLRGMVPDAFEQDLVATVYGRHEARLDDELAAGDEANEEADGGGEYPIDDDTRIVVCTHAQLGRRGFSKFMRAIYTKLAPEDGEDRPPFALVIDEVSELIRQSRVEIDLAHRTGQRTNPDASGGTIVPRDHCPKFNHSSNCANCILVGHGGVSRFNKFGIRELVPPPRIETDADGNRLRKPRYPLSLTDTDLTTGPEVRVGDTTFARQLLAYRGRPIDTAARRTADVFLYQGDETPDAVEDILGHMLQFAFRPVVTIERPVNDLGEPVKSRTLALRYEQGDTKWADDIVFPRTTCEVPRLRFADLMVLEQIRRFARKAGVGVVLTGATLAPDDRDILREVWPGLDERQHPYPDRKIRQVAIVAPDGYRGGDSLIGPDGKLATAPLEAHGLGLVFSATRKLAESLHEAVNLAQPSAWLAVENFEQFTLRKTLHKEGELRTFVTYSRGVLGLGANVLGVRHLLADALAFRSIAGFNPGEITPEQFATLRDRERVALILQNLGRALRGEEGKTVVLFLLNADEGLLDEVRRSPAIVEGAELPPVVARGKDLAMLVDQAGRWLAAGGGDWPEADASKAGPRAGRPKRDKAAVLAAAEEAIGAGMKWRDFVHKHRPERILDKEELARLKDRFTSKARPETDRSSS